MDTAGTTPPPGVGPDNESPSRRLADWIMARSKAPRVGAIIALQRRATEDQIFKLAAMLAYYLILSVAPILVMIVSVVLLVFGLLPAQARHDIISVTANKVPGSAQFLPLALERLRRHSGALAVISVLTSAYFGSRLFKVIDYCFGIIFRVPPRSLMPEQFMAFKMLLFFVLVAPVLITISAIPGLVSKHSVVQTLLNDSAPLALALRILSVLTGVLVAFVLFLMIYVVVPNRRVPIRMVWKGALIAGILLEIYLVAFPLYAAQYLDGENDAATAGFAVVAIVFFYFFGLMLLLGAEINAAYLERDRHALLTKESPLPREEAAS